MHTLSISQKKCITFCATKSIAIALLDCHKQSSMQSADFCVSSSRMSSELLAALTGLSDSEPVCAAALINPTLCDFVSTSLFLSLSLIFSLVYFSSYSLTHPFFPPHFIEKFKFRCHVVPNPCIAILSAEILTVLFQEFLKMSNKRCYLYLRAVKQKKILSG